MEWTDTPGSPLTDLLAKKTLHHPTSAAFSAQAWRTAVGELEEPSPRDYILAAGAVEYGFELQTLRAHVSHVTVDGLSVRSGLRLLAAAANQQYLTLVERGAVAYRQAADEVHFERLHQAPIASIWGQSLTGDDHITSLVDSLPHWLFHLMQIPAGARIAPPAHPQAFAARALAHCSLEHELRDLWHDVLWSNYAVSGGNGERKHVPLDRELATRWFAWHLRQQSLDSFELAVDMGARIVAGGRLTDVEPPVTRTVVHLKRGPGGKRAFVVGPASPQSPLQRIHAGEQDMLDRLHTGLFLDEPLPKLGNGELTARELAKAWWVLSDLGRLVGGEIGGAVLRTDKLVGRAAVAVDVCDLVTVIADALAITPERAGLILDSFTTDPAQTARLFTKGVWFTPLLAEPDSERRYLLLAPLLAGSALRRVEHWLELGGISDTSGVKGRGRPFERHVRDSLRQAVEENSLLQDAQVVPEGLKKRGMSEEIDLLVRVGNVVLVGEVKCFTRPAEAMEQFNYLRSLAGATEQAARKQTWCEDNRADIAERLGIADRGRIAALQFKGIVVVNHSIGLGLQRRSVPIVDLHYLRLLLGHGSYQAKTRFERDVGMSYDTAELYADEADFVARLDANLRSPPVMERYLDAIEWTETPFMRSDGGTRLIAIPTLVRDPM